MNKKPRLFLGFRGLRSEARRAVAEKRLLVQNSAREHAWPLTTLPNIVHGLKEADLERQKAL